MTRFIFRPALCLTILLALAVPAGAITFTATLLHPDDFLDTTGLANSNSTQVGDGLQPSFSGSHALLWSGTAASVVDLHPSTGFTATFGFGASATHQVGYGSGSATSGNDHALLWNGTAASIIDLNPSSYIVSYAEDVSDTQQVGWGYDDVDFLSHALLWSGTAASVVDLHPEDFTESYAVGISGTTQVGSGYGPTTGFSNHALLWKSLAATVVDLHPAGYTESQGLDVSGETQVGFAVTGGNNHALLWKGSSLIKIDLNPAGFQSSEALGVSSFGQAGAGRGTPTGNSSHALYWNGTAASVVDLHPSLSALGFEFVTSWATGIADNGTIVGYAVDDGNYSHAILWTPSLVSGVAADYNNNGTVDAGDYVAWRKGSTPLQNEVDTIGSNTPSDYTAWRMRFGNPPGSGSIEAIPIPEPSNIAWLVLLSVSLLWPTRAPHRQRRSRIRKNSENETYRDMPVSLSPSDSHPIRAVAIAHSGFSVHASYRRDPKFLDSENVRD